MVWMGGQGERNKPWACRLRERASGGLTEHPHAMLASLSSCHKHPHRCWMTPLQHGAGELVWGRCRGSVARGLWVERRGQESQSFYLFFTCFYLLFTRVFTSAIWCCVFLCFGLFSAVPLTAYLVGLRHKELCKLTCSIFQVLVSFRRAGGLLKVAFPLPVVTDKKSHIFLLCNVRPQHMHVHVLGLVTRSREARI